jgi:threonine/homoserine/homoserine lactone efflux protein
MTSAVTVLIPLLTSGIESLLNAFHQGGAAEAVQAGEQVALAILQEAATIKGVSVNWSNPAAVQAYIATLPAFVPIPEPVPPTPITQATQSVGLPTAAEQPPQKK